MSEMKQYDIIVFGAGAAGLALASELSKDFKVLVFDRKNAINETTKSWLIPDMVITEGGAEEILPYMKNGVRRFLANTFQGVNVQWQANFKYHFAKEHELLDFWGQTILDNGSEVLLDCWYQDSFITHDRVVISTSRGEFCSKLLIDASGGQSPIRGKYALREHWYWWSVCGAIVRFPEGLPEGMEVGDYQLWQTFEDTNPDEEASLSQGRPIWEYEVLDENTAFVFIFYLGQFRVPQSTMETMFHHVLHNEDSTSDFHNTTIDEVKYGWYPSGGSRSQKVTRDRVVFVGSAGCWTSPCGWGMSFIIANYKKYAQHLGKAIKRNRLSKERLSEIIDLSARSKYQILLDQVATHFLSFSTASELNVFISLFDPDGELGDKGPLLCEKLFTLTITEKEALSMLIIIMRKIGLRNLIDGMPKRDYPLIVLLLMESGIAMTLRFLRDIKVLPPRKADTGLDASGFSITD